MIPWCASPPDRRDLLQPDAVRPSDRPVFARSAWRRSPPMTGGDARRSSSPRDLERNLALRDALKPIAKRHGITIAAVCRCLDLAGRA